LCVKLPSSLAFFLNFFHYALVVVFFVTDLCLLLWRYTNIFIIIYYYYCICFSFSVLSQEIGWEEHPHNDLFCVGWGVKALLNHQLCRVVNIEVSSIADKVSPILSQY